MLIKRDGDRCFARTFLSIFDFPLLLHLKNFLTNCHGQLKVQLYPKECGFTIQQGQQ